MEWRDRDEAGRRVDLAAIGFRAIDIVEHGEIGGRGIVGELDPHGGERRIAGETDMRLGLPGQRGDLHRALADRDAGARAGQQIAAREHGGNQQRNSRGQNLQTHETHSLADKP